MTSQRDLERTLDAYFEIGADEVADRVIDAALLTIEHAPQRRAGRVPWRFPDMTSSMKLLTAAAVIVVAVVGTSWVLGRGTGPGVGGGPSPTPSVAPSPSPSAPATLSPSPSAVSTAAWRTFTSNRYGYTTGYPTNWTATPATRNWIFASDRGTVQSAGSDQFVDKSLPADLQVGITAFSVPLLAGTSEDEWITTYYGAEPAACQVTITALVATTVDGLPARIGHSPCADSEAFVFVGDRVYVFVVWRTGQGPLLNAFLSTVRFQVTSPAGSPPPSLGPSASPG